MSLQCSINVVGTPRQVASIWQVSSGPQVSREWSHETLSLLGGRSVASNVWLQLKDQHFTGNPKRLIEEEQERHVKKIKVLGGRRDSQSTPVTNSPTLESLKRRRRGARKKSLLATLQITAWLSIDSKTLPDPTDHSRCLKLREEGEKEEEESQEARWSIHNSYSFPGALSPGNATIPVPRPTQLMKTRRRKTSSGFHSTSHTCKQLPAPRALISVSSKPNQ